jgi:hypothetical protein
VFQKLFAHKDGDQLSFEAPDAQGTPSRVAMNLYLDGALTTSVGDLPPYIHLFSALLNALRTLIKSASTRDRPVSLALTYYPSHLSPLPLAMASQHRMEDDSTGDVFLNEGPCLTIAEHALQCTSLFHEYMSEPEIVPDPAVLDDQRARFALWASDMDVYGPPNASLDSRLRFSPTAVDMIHQLLDVICETLKSCTYLPHLFRM